MRSSVLQHAHILVVDPRPEELRLLISQLQGSGARVSIATEPQQGLQRAQVLDPDLILINVQLPRMDGLALCRLLRQAPVTRDTPIFFLSATSTVEERLQGFALGAADYITRPFVPEEVVARIGIHLTGLTSQEECCPPYLREAPKDFDEVTLRAAIRLLDQYLDAPPPLDDIARLVGTHSKRLTAIFRRHVGMTVFAYIREERLRKGQQLLADSHLSIQDIADLVGFRSAANFATSFRRCTGMTPSAFREQVRKQKKLESPGNRQVESSL